MKRFLSASIIVLIITVAGIAFANEENLLTNGNFENGLDGWSSIWFREGSACGSTRLTDNTESANTVHSGSHAVYFNNTCEKDWSFGSKEKINVTYESKYEVSYWTRVKGGANFRVSVVLYNESGSVLSWDVLGASKKNDTNGEWVHATGTIWVKYQDASYIIVRCIGTGSGEAYIDDITFKSVGKLPLYLDFSTGDKDSVEMRMDVTNGLFNVTLPGTDLKWEQIRTWGPKVSKVYSYDDTSIFMEITGGYNVSVSLTKGVPEIVYSISSNGTSSLNMFPHPFKSISGHVVLPLNEGISFPVTSAEEIGVQSYSLASGHGLCMAFW